MDEKFKCPKCGHTFLVIYRDKVLDNDFCIFCATNSWRSIKKMVEKELKTT